LYRSEVFGDFSMRNKGTLLSPTDRERRKPKVKSSIDFLFHSVLISVENFRLTLTVKTLFEYEALAVMRVWHSGQKMGVFGILDP
jgi:hypothetical protein